jgi:hypothetical protein
MDTINTTGDEPDAIRDFYGEELDRTTLLKPGETIGVSADGDRWSEFNDKYRIGLVNVPRGLCARVKLPKTMWSQKKVRVVVIINSDGRSPPSRSPNSPPKHRSKRWSQR